MNEINEGQTSWKALTALLLCLGLSLSISACFDNGNDALDPGDDDGDEPGGDTSGYAGVMAWSFGDGGEGSGIRVWNLPDSEFIATVDEGGNGAHLSGVLSGNDQALTYTVEEEALGDHILSQVQYLNLSQAQLLGLPWAMDNGLVRASAGADLDRFGGVVSFAERVYDQASGELQRYGAGVWQPGQEQAQSLVQSDRPVSCTQMDPEGSFMVLNREETLYAVAVSGGDPQPIQINHPSLDGIETEPRSGSRCAFSLGDNGNRLAFTGRLSNESGEGAFFTDLDSGQTVRLTPSIEMTLVDWQMAANGRQAVLLYRQPQDEAEEVFNYFLRAVNLINPGASNEIDQFSLSADDPITPTVAISDEGTVIARSGYDEDGIYVKVMGFSGSDPRRIQGDATTMGDGELGLVF